MENSYTKYLELIEQGKIDPNEPIKPPCVTKGKLELLKIEKEQLKTKS